MEISRQFLNGWRVAMWVAAAALLSLPAIAMQFFPDAGVDWTGSDFVIMGVMLLIACGLVELGWRMARGRDLAYLVGVVVAVGTGFVTVWANLAVGMILSERNPENLVFLGVIAIALVGAFAVRFAPRGMAATMTAAGLTQAAIGAYVGIAGLDDLYTAMLIGGFALPWLLAAALFRKADHGQLGVAARA